MKHQARTIDKPMESPAKTIDKTMKTSQAIDKSMKKQANTIHSNETSKPKQSGAIEKQGDNNREPKRIQ